MVYTTDVDGPIELVEDANGVDLVPEDANDEDIGIELVVEADEDEKVVELTSDDDGPRKVVEDADWVDCIV